MKKAEVIETVKTHLNAIFPVDDLVRNLTGKDRACIVTSRGAISICALRRNRSYIGFAVWSSAKQGFVAGSWRQPLSWTGAVEAEQYQPWEG